MQHPKYRADIDGLRAIAVASVLVFHAFPSALPGGFIGVDIFFVISGFLISTIILQSTAGEGFSYREFYARRIRRIFPALLLVLVATLAGGWYVLLTDEFADLGLQTVGGAAFFANFVFLGQAGYFDTSAETKPLLHLWSLGIEEQFYIFWPILIGLAWKRRWPMVRVMVVLAVISFLVNVLTVHPHRAAAFYSPASRFWELMAGGILAGMRMTQKAPGRWRHHVQSVLGVGLLALGLVMTRSDKAFPGWWALLPVLGAVSCIAAGPQGFFNRHLLSNRVLVWIGLISYPLYLWHWPLLAYARIVEGELPSPWVRGAAVLATVVLAWATYRFVERAVRNRPGPSVVRVLSGGMVIVAAIGGLAFFDVLKPRHSNPTLQKVADATLDVDYYAGFKLDQIGPHLIYRAGEGPGKVLLLGDSHVQQYAPRALELLRTTPATTKAAYFATQGACPAIPGVHADKNIGCSERRTAMLEFARSPEVDTVVIGGCWNCYFLGTGALDYYYRDGGPVHPFQNGDGIEQSLASLGRLLRELAAQKKVYLLLDNPVGANFEPKQLIEGSRLTTMKVESATPRAAIPADQVLLNERLKAIGVAAGVEVIDAIANLCEGDQCLRTMPDEAPAYKDGGHLRPRYTRGFGVWLDPALRR